MKKVLVYLLALLSLFAIVACKEEPVVEQEPVINGEVVLTLKAQSRTIAPKETVTITLEGREVSSNFLVNNNIDPKDVLEVSFHNVEEIKGDGLSFSTCTNLYKVEFDNNLKEIGNYAFEECSSLETVLIPESVKKIGMRAFYSCSALTDVVFKGITPPSIYTENGKETFNPNTVEAITVPESAKENYQEAVGELLSSKVTFPDYFFFEALDDTTIYISSYENYFVNWPVTATDLRLQYSVGSDDEWKEYKFTANEAEPEWCIRGRITGDKINLEKGEKLYMKAIGNNSSFSTPTYNYYYYFVVDGGAASANGNIMFLLDETGKQKEVPDYAFYMLFNQCNITTAPQLPATTLGIGCYYSMFSGCTSLTDVPELPAQTLKEKCYCSMFQDCSGLTTVPENMIYATEVAPLCCYGMFWGCSSLTNAPVLAATVLATSCYEDMFYDCTGLVSVPEDMLKATTLADKCYRYMFAGCSSLTNAPVLHGTKMQAQSCDFMFWNCQSLVSVPSSMLPATEMGVGCYKSMFNGCTSLTNAPALPATVLADNCYENMFYGCSDLIAMDVNVLPATQMEFKCYYAMFEDCKSLTRVPQIKATELAGSCFYSMFHGCSSLVTVPADYLPVTTLTDSCYYSMFQNCTSLTNAPDLPATKLASNCYVYMFAYCESLTTTPYLPATETAYQSYKWMFNGCKSLNYVSVGITTALNSWNTNNSWQWLSAVAENGTFKCPSSCSTPTTCTDTSSYASSKVPTGWTIIN